MLVHLNTGSCILLCRRRWTTKVDSGALHDITQNSTKLDPTLLLVAPPCTGMEKRAPPRVCMHQLHQDHTQRAVLN